MAHSVGMKKAKLSSSSDAATSAAPRPTAGTMPAAAAAGGLDRRESNWSSGIYRRCCHPWRALGSSSSSRLSHCCRKRICAIALLAVAPAGHLPTAPTPRPRTRPHCSWRHLNAVDRLAERAWCAGNMSESTRKADRKPRRPVKSSAWAFRHSAAARLRDAK